MTPRIIVTIAVAVIVLFTIIFWIYNYRHSPTYYKRQMEKYHSKMDAALKASDIRFAIYMQKYYYFTGKYHNSVM